MVFFQHAHVLCHGPTLIWATCRSLLSVLGCGTYYQLRCICQQLYVLKASVEGTGCSIYGSYYSCLGATYKCYYSLLLHTQHSLQTCCASSVLFSVSTAGESNTVLASAPSSPANGILSFCNASFNVLANFSNDLEHVLSFTSYENRHSTVNFHMLNRLMIRYRPILDSSETD